MKKSMVDTLNFTTLLKVFLQNFRKNGGGGGKPTLLLYSRPKFSKKWRGG